MTDRDFTRVAERVFAMAGIVLEPHKRQMIYSRLSRRLRARDFPDFGSYLDHLDAGRDTAELQEFINTLTTNLTSIFRESHHFDHLEKAILGPLKTAPTKRLRIWSAGCSSGEEPYSIALCLRESFGQVPLDAKILATDIDTRVLDKARRGQYPGAKLSELPQRLRKHLSIDKASGDVEVPAALRQIVAFRQLNLLERWPMSGPFDAIFCRNVMIYFDASTKETLIRRFAGLLRSGGFLYLGHSEAILGPHPLLQNCGTTIYRRTAAHG